MPNMKVIFSSLHQPRRHCRRRRFAIGVDASDDGNCEQNICTINAERRKAREYRGRRLLLYFSAAASAYLRSPPKR